MKSLLRIAALLGLALVLGAGSDEFTSLAAKSARRKYDAALAAAQAEYDKQAAKARDAYLAELNAAFKSALRTSSSTRPIGSRRRSI